MSRSGQWPRLIGGQWSRLIGGQWSWLSMRDESRHPCSSGSGQLLQQNIEVERQGATVHRWYRVGLHCVSCLAWVFHARTAGRDRPSWALVLCNNRLLDVMDPVWALVLVMQASEMIARGAFSDCGCVAKMRQRTNGGQRCASLLHTGCLHKVLEEQQLALATF